MPTELPGEVTRLLGDIEAGKEQAKHELFQLVYEELRRLAKGLMRSERPDHTWQPTVLVHEALLRLYDDSKVFGKNRAYFFGAVVKAMRQLLREHARGKQTQQSGGGWKRVPLDDLLDFYGQQVDVPDLEESLEQLAALNQRQHEVVTLRFYGGWHMKEIAQLLEVSVATVENDFRAARAFLRSRLSARE